MACFTATLVEAAAVTIVKAVVKKKEKEKEKETALMQGGKNIEEQTSAPRIKLSEKLSWLNMMLWGGSILLLFEHVWHGEVVPWFPFLTAASSPESTQTMLHEIMTVGVGMAVLVTAVWAVMVIAADLITKRSAEPSEEEVTA